VNEVKDSFFKTILVPFVFSQSQAYMLEFGNYYMRVYVNYGLVETSPGVAFELVTPWSSADLALLAWTQSADVLYMVHPNYPPYLIKRLASTSWTATIATLYDGPFLDPETPGYPLVVTSGPTQVGNQYQMVLTANPQFTIATNTSLGAGLGSQITTTAANGFYVGLPLIFKNHTTSVLYGPYLVTKIIDAVTFQCLVFTGSANDKAGDFMNPSPFVNEHSALGYTGDGGRLIRLLYGATWVTGVIQPTSSAGSYFGTAEVSVLMNATIPNATSITTWQRGVYYGGTSLGPTDASGTNPTVVNPGYPSALGFHQDRLFLGGTPGFPQRWDSSRTSDYLNFSETNPDGSVPADAGLGGNLNEGGVDPIRWFSSDEQGLLMGTAGAEFWLTASNPYEAISATNIAIKKSTSYGSSYARAIQAGKATLFIQLAARKIFELSYFFQVAGFRSTNLSELAYHITQGGITQLAYQDEPNPIVWAVRTDGTLIGMSYSRDLDQVRAGWHKHILGGKGYPGNGQPVVESIAVIPGPAGDKSDLWMIVKRQINGLTVRYVEYMEKTFDDSVDQLDGFHVDCGSTYSNVVSGVSIGKALPAPCYKAAHGLTTGKKVRLRNVFSFTDLEDKMSSVTVVDADNFTLDSIDSSAEIPMSGTFDAYIMASTISGLSYLEGETVSVLGDGAVYPDTVVSGGSITISQPCSVVAIGYGFTSDAKLVRIEAGSQNGTSMGKMRKLSNIRYLVNQTAAFKHGSSFDNLTQLTFRKVSDVMGQAVPLLSGITDDQPIAGDYDRDGTICIRQDQPLPLMILGVMPQQTVQDNQ